MENQTNNFGKIIHSWTVPEYMAHERPRIWYITASVIGFFLMIYCFFTSNFLFAVIIIMAALIIIINDGQHPTNVKIAITEEGVVIGRSFYEYEELKNFAIVNKPNYQIKNLYFERKSAISQRLSIPLINNDPQEIKNTLIKRLPEDKERTDIPVSEQLARLLKL